MASIINDPNGLKRIQFVAPDGKRKTIRLGKMAKRSAEAIKLRVEQLVVANVTGHAIDGDTARWVAELDTTLADKLASVQLIKPREKQEPTGLGDFLDAYHDRRTDVKPATREVWRQPIRNLKEFFGGDKAIDSITEGEAEDFRLWLLEQKLAKTTVAKRLQFARQFFKDAKKRKLIDENPFAEVSEQAVVEKQLSQFVLRQDVEKILGHCNTNWRLIVALSRYGGLRCPSEVLSVKWENIDWDKQTMNVFSPKTEHHAGKKYRTVPLFAGDTPLLEILRDAYESAPEGAEYVVDASYRAAANTKDGWRNINLRTQFLRILEKAGVEPWPSLFHAVRAARETELLDQHPIHTVTYWLGNSPRIALKHYARVRQDDWDRASGQQGGAKSGALVAQNTAQHPSAPSTHQVAAHKKTLDESRVYANSRDTVRRSAQMSSGEDRIRTCGPVTRSRI